MSLRFTSIRSRFLAIHLPIVLVVIAAFIGGAEWFHYKSEIDRLSQEMRTFAASQSIILSEPVADSDTSRIRAAVASTIANPEIRGIAIYDAPGNLIDSYGSGLDEPDVMSYRTAINYADEQGIRKVGSLKIAMNEALVIERIKERLMFGMIFGVIAIVAALAAAQLAFSRTVVTPLLRLLDVIRSTKGGEKREVIEWKSEDELGKVIAAFNEMQVREAEYEKQLAEIREDLEGRVSTRTLALDNARMDAITANKAKSDFLANMSHELRTPLNSVLGFAQILRNIRDDRWSAKEIDYLDMIESSGNILLRLIDQMLDLNQIEAGAIMIDVEDVPLAASVEEAVGVVTAQSQAASVLIDIDIESFVNVSVRADRFRLKQILLNLLSNAIKYNRQRGNISLHAEVLDDGRVRIDVSDTGIGIAKEDQAAAFEAFNRLNQDQGKTHGAGLGLTISRQLVELMGGTITVESDAGQGSTFSVFLKKGSEAQPTRDFIRLQIAD